MPELPYMTDEAKRWIGHETVEVSDPVSLRQIREYLAGTDDWNPLYYDEEYAKGTQYGGIIAPRMFYRAPLRKVLLESELQEDGQYPDRSVPASTAARWREARRSRSSSRCAPATCSP